MKRSPTVFRVGTRPSNLALTQTRDALDRIEDRLPDVTFDMMPITSIGDTDRATDLRESPADFFTRELDGALLSGDIDMAMHSAKDLPDPMPEGIDWFWLPWREEPRDVLVLAQGKTLADLPDAPVIGVSSERREAYCREQFPKGIQKTIRGNIEERIAQVDEGKFDIVVMAAAALMRLNLAERISHWISLDELEVPEGQGFLAVTFRADDERLMALRGLFSHAVVLAGAGVSNRSLCTLTALRALEQCDVCLYDSLIDQDLLQDLPAHAIAIDVGKRCGAHSKEQHETTRLLCACARQGKRVVRLKGGDPGIFGRLAEETAALEALGIPFRVIPGISALQAATTGTGMLLTRRDVSRGFVALTPRVHGGGLARCDGEMKNRLPVIYYMSIKAVKEIVEQMIEDGHAPSTPAALVFNAGGADEQVIRAQLNELPQLHQLDKVKQPGLIIVGDITGYGYRKDLGALSGNRVLLTVSQAIQEKAADCVRDLGGYPIPMPLIKLKPRVDIELNPAEQDWVAVTSPSSVHALMEIIAYRNTDMRSLPRIMVCGRGTADAFATYGIQVDVVPESGFSAASLIETARAVVKRGERILRVRSDKAGPELADALQKIGADVEDLIIYDNHRIEHDQLADFDAVFFASASAVESFIAQWGRDALMDKTTCVIGQPTARALQQAGMEPSVIAREATVIGAMNSLAAYFVGEKVCIPTSD